MIEGNAEGMTFRVSPPADTPRPFYDDDGFALGDERAGG